MQPLTITQTLIVPFTKKFIRPFTFAGTTVYERVGYYWKIVASDGSLAQGEIAPLSGISLETIKKAKHDLDELSDLFEGYEVPLDMKTLLQELRKNDALINACSSARFGIESALFSLVALNNQVSLTDFLEGENKNVQSAFLLQGTNEQILNEAKHVIATGHKVFKLKVGNRNIPLDVKNVQDLRALVGKDLILRLDGNRVWSMSEAVLFAECVGHQNIEFIEEPLSTMDRLSEFYHATHMPVALDETLAVVRCGINAPGRCMPTLANHDGVKAYVIKPMVIGGVVKALDWIEEARENGRKAILSSAFETPVGFAMVEALASLSDEVAGLGTQRFYE